MPCDSDAPFYEFFAGGGLARLGLEPAFRCIFANDNDPAKAAAYRRTHGDRHFRLDDVWNLHSSDLPGRAALAWASFPCQDLSLAGPRGGLAAPRSGAFWGFHRLMAALLEEGRAPDLLALENVCGLLTSHGGADFAALIGALDALGYRAGALEIDASLFVPQSRPRLFVIATRQDPRPDLIANAPNPPFHSAGVRAAAARLPEALRAKWIWWLLPSPPLRNARLADLLDDCESHPGESRDWNTNAQTRALVAMMSSLQRARLEAIQASGRREIGALFRRIRIENGRKVQRAEARFDGLAGCLRTPAGGSSRQTLLFVEGESLRSRLLSPREAARLMGASEDYPIPDNRNAALHLFGDAVAVPVVRWLSEHLLARTAGPWPANRVVEGVRGVCESVRRPGAGSPNV